MIPFFVGIKIFKFAYEFPFGTIALNQDPYANAFHGDFHGDIFVVFSKLLMVLGEKWLVVPPTLKARFLRWRYGFGLFANKPSRAMYCFINVSSNFLVWYLFADAKRFVCDFLLLFEICAHIYCVSSIYVVVVSQKITCGYEGSQREIFQ